MKKFYALDTSGREASIMIYGEITSWPWMESDVSSYNLAREIEGLDVDVINVYVNSPGGEVGEGLAIYNALKRHQAKVITYADGFACSIASVIFAAGDERVMYDTSLLMIHNAWTYASGDADDLRKMADDLETINAAAKAALQSVATIDDAELQAMLDAETWITASEALEKGFATRIDGVQASTKVSASARAAVYNRILHNQPAQPADLGGVMEALAEIKAAIEGGAKPREETKKTNFWNAFSGKDE